MSHPGITLVLDSKIGTNQCDVALRQRKNRRFIRLSADYVAIVTARVAAGCRLAGGWRRRRW